MLLGQLFALLSTLANGVASVVESVGARHAETGHRGARSVFRQPVYLVGLVIDLLGFVASLLAMQHLPLFVVQSAVACSVGVTALIAARMGVRIGTTGRAALIAMVIGLVLLGISGAAERPTALPIVWQWLLLVLAVPLYLLLRRTKQNPGPRAAVLLAVLAGVCFTVVAVAGRTFHLPDSLGAALLHPNLLTIIAAGTVGTMAFAAALERGSVTMVSAVNYATETVLPSTIGLLLLGDSVRSGFAAVAGIGFVAAVGGALVLARFAAPPSPVPSGRGR